MSSRNSELIEQLKKIDNLEIIERASDVKRLSKDFYNYSPNGGRQGSSKKNILFTLADF